MADDAWITGESLRLGRNHQQLKYEALKHLCLAQDIANRLQQGEMFNLLVIDNEAAIS